MTDDKAIPERILNVGYLNPIIRHLGCPVGELSPFVSDEKGDAGDSSRAVQWWNIQTREEKDMLEPIITAAAAPALLINLSIMLEEQKLITSVLLTPGIEQSAPWLLLGDRADKVILRLFPDRETATFAVLDYLFAGGSPGVSNVRFNAASADFLVFLAIVDLYRRIRYTSLIEHSPMGAMSMDDIHACLMDGIRHGDPRWLVPFSLPGIPQVSRQLSRDDVMKSTDALKSINIIRRAGNDDAVELDEAGMYVASSLERRYCSLSLQAFGSEQDGRPYGRSCLFFRGDRLLWFVDNGGAAGQMTGISSVSLETARSVLDELFTPLTPPHIRIREAAPAAVPAVSAAPPDAVKCSRCGAGMDEGTVFCVECGARAEEGEKGLECMSCRAPLGPGTKFCPKCGAPVRKEPERPAEARKCSKCGNMIKPEMKFCPKCGTPVKDAQQAKPAEKKCGRCGIVLAREMRFCPKCGGPAVN